LSQKVVYTPRPSAAHRFNSPTNPASSGMPSGLRTASDSRTWAGVWKYDP
jgi:hypothetical protein